MLTKIELAEDPELKYNDTFKVDLPINLNKIINNNEYCILKFSANWCKPCKKLTKEIDKLIDEYEIKNCILININYDKHENIFENIGILKMPTIIFIRNNNIIKKYNSSLISDFKETISEIIIEKPGNIKENIEIIQDF